MAFAVLQMTHLHQYTSPSEMGEILKDWQPSKIRISSSTYICCYGSVASCIYIWNERKAKAFWVVYNSSMTEPQPKYSAYREASFGHAIFEIKNRSHAYYSWHRNQDGYAVKADSLWFFNRFWHPVDDSTTAQPSWLYSVSGQPANSSQLPGNGNMNTNI